MKGDYFMPGLKRNVLDDVQLALLLAADNPNSPFFLRTMYLLRMKLLKEMQYSREETEQMLFTIIQEMNAEKNLNLENEMFKAAQEHAAYIASWNEYQKEVRKIAIEEYKLSPQELHDHLLATNKILEDEIGKLKNIDIAKAQLDISERWAALQGDKANLVAEKLKGKGFITDESQVNHIKNAAQAKDINQLIKVAPHLVKLNEHEVNKQAEVVTTQGMVMQELRLVFALAEIQKELHKEGAPQKEISPKELLDVLKKNPEMIKALKEVNDENPAIAEKSKALIKDALVNNKPYIEAQIKSKQEQIEENKKRAELALKNAKEAKEAKEAKTTPRYTPPGAKGV